MKKQKLSSMKTKSRPWVMLIAIVAGFISCAKDEATEELVDDADSEYVIDSSLVKAPQNEHLVSRQQAIGNASVFLQEFQKFIYPEVPKEVASVIPFTKHNLHMTRAAKEKDDTLFYAINYKDNRGFVLASADDRLTPVLAYIDHGNYSADDTTNVGFNMFLNNIINKYYRRSDKSLLRGNERNVGMSNGSEMIYQLLYTDWGPMPPFNRYFKEGMMTERCIALGQICVNMRRPAVFAYKEKIITPQWNTIRQKLIYNNGVLDPDGKEADQMAMLMASFSEKVPDELTYMCKDSYLAHLLVMGFDVKEVSHGRIDDPEYIWALRKRCLIYATGVAWRYSGQSAIYTDRHAWVIDGFFYAENGDVKGTYLHCNWGMSGDKNGYFLCNGFDSDDIPDIDYGDSVKKVSYDGGCYSYHSCFGIVSPK